jgi:hypothetical protein
MKTKTIRIAVAGLSRIGWLYHMMVVHFSAGNSQLPSLWRICMKELFETMRDGVPPKCGGKEGLLSAVVALGIDRAAREGRVVDLEPTWERLGK